MERIGCLASARRDKGFFRHSRARVRRANYDVQLHI
jgi:hypothetical protein